MRGIDVSSHDRWPFKESTEECYNESDFVIVKATQGTGYENPHFRPAIDRAIGDGKLVGAYHYAGGGDAEAEARHFRDVISDYIGTAVPCVDWEAMIGAQARNPSWGDTDWVRRFADAYHGMTGTWPMVYVQASAIWQVASCHPDCPLWVAGYRSDDATWDVPGFAWGTDPWDGYAVWQFTSGHETTDRNVSDLTRADWARMAESSESVGRRLREMVEDGVWWVEHGNLGYDQGDRDSWVDSGYQTGTEVDCSSFVIGLLRKHGFDVGDASWTGNMREELCAHGWAVVPNDGNPQLGDILLNDGHHTAISCGDGTMIQASRGEEGHRVRGGEPGDQDDYETNHSPYRDYPWDCYLRYGGGPDAGGTSIDVDGDLGPRTARAMQVVFCGQDFGDRVISSQPLAVRPLWPSDSGGIEWRSPAEGSLTIAAMQRAVGVDDDGFAGPDTTQALQRHLMANGYDVGPSGDDGYIGHDSCRALQRYLNDRL